MTATPPDSKPSTDPGFDRRLGRIRDSLRQDIERLKEARQVSESGSGEVEVQLRELRDEYQEKVGSLRRQMETASDPEAFRQRVRAELAELRRQAAHYAEATAVLSAWAEGTLSVLVAGKGATYDQSGKMKRPGRTSAKKRPTGTGPVSQS